MKVVTWQLRRCAYVLCFGLITVCAQSPQVSGQETIDLPADVDQDAPISPSDLPSQTMGNEKKGPKGLLRQLMGETPPIVDGRIVLPELVAPSISTDSVVKGGADEPIQPIGPQPLQPLPEDFASRGGSDIWSMAYWAAPNTFSYPRYFEDRMLERHGHERFPLLQPAISGARFFGTIPALPYLMAINPPLECEYTLGYLRPGSCAPALLQRPPLDRRGVIAESAAIATGVIALP